MRNTIVKTNKYTDIPDVIDTINVTEELNKYDQIIHRKQSAQFDEWYEYDDRGNLIHYKNSFGDEEWYEYDENGNKIYEKHYDGNEVWYSHDSQDRVIHRKWKNGYEEWYEYNEDGRCHIKNSNGDVFHRNDDLHSWYE